MRSRVAAWIAAVLGAVLMVAVACSPSAERGAGTGQTASALTAGEVGVWTVADAGPSEIQPRRVATALAYDAARGRIVMFGGSALLSGTLTTPPAKPLDDTWEWDGTRWTEMCAACTAAQRPPPRLHHAMAYDAQRKRVVLYGGWTFPPSPPSHVSLLADTWEWDGITWQKRFECPASGDCPGPRAMHAATYDGSRSAVVVMGGYTNVVTQPFGGEQPQDPGCGTFDWNGVSWSRRASPCPPAENQAGGMLVFDKKRSRLVFVGGAGADCASGVTFAETWEWTDGPGWTMRCGPSAGACAVPRRWSSALAFDAARGTTILFGGIGSDPQCKSLADTWEWDGTLWSSVCGARTGSTSAPCGPGKRGLHALAFDQARGEAVLFGGGPGELGDLAYPDTWRYHGRGGACTTDAECDSHHCVDGVCCESATCGVCESCSEPSARGVCTPIVDREDPGSCSGGFRCKAAISPAGKRCGATQGKACTTGDDCFSGSCSDRVCCDRACDRSCDTCSKARGAPADGTCGSARARDPGVPACISRRCTGEGPACDPDAPCASDDDCALGGRCAAGKCSEVPCNCAPYACNADGTCKSACATVEDCTAGNVCDRTHRCQPASTSSSGGCSLARGGASPGGLAAVAFALGVLARWRRKRS